MIIMLGQGLLYDLHRQRHAMMLRYEKRKAFVYCCLITVCVTGSVLLWIIYG